MRNLTIKRTKSFVACLAKMKIYIEDPTSNEMLINHTPCRKIGDLKNGEEKTFQIAEQEAKVFVIADQYSKNFCSEYYQLPEGQEDIILSGKNMFNPASGNAFRFDNNESKEVAEHRKRGTRKGIFILIAAIVFGGVIGYLVSSGLFSNKTPKAKNFSSHGMTITLTDEFKETDLENFTVAYGSKEVAVVALKEAFALADGFEDYTLTRYAELIAEVNQLNPVEIKTEKGLTYFEYDFTNSESDKVYHYFSYVYKTDDAFWLVQFSTLKKDVDKYADQMTEWAKSVVFSK